MINNNPVNSIFSLGGIASSTLYNHVYILPSYKNNSVSVSYNDGNGGTYWSGCYGFDIADGTEIETSKSVFSKTNTVTVSMEKCNNMILVIN